MLDDDAVSLALRRVDSAGTYQRDDRPGYVIPWTGPRYETEKVPARQVLLALLDHLGLEACWCTHGPDRNKIVFYEKEES